jgi:hypothetical protein
MKTSKTGINIIIKGTSLWLDPKIAALRCPAVAQLAIEFQKSLLVKPKTFLKLNQPHST